MADTDAYALQRPGMNSFLFADVDVEASGMRLAVLSALARFSVDPWQEAGRSATLPRMAAANRLAQMIAACLWSLSDDEPGAGQRAARRPAARTQVGFRMVKWIAAIEFVRDFDGLGGEQAAATRITSLIVSTCQYERRHRSP